MANGLRTLLMALNQIGKGHVQRTSAAAHAQLDAIVHEMDTLGGQQLQRKVFERVEFLYDELGIEAMRCARRHHANTRAHASAHLGESLAAQA